MPETTYRDRWGRNLGEIPSTPGEIVPYIVSEEGEYTYIRYFADDENGKCLVKRVTKSQTGSAIVTTIEHAYGAWTDRAALEYIPVNEAIPETAE